jgi:hypothetical protein
VVIAPEAFALWLDCRNVDAQTAAALLIPPPEGLFEAYEISTAVNKADNDGADLLRPVQEVAESPESPAPPAPKRPRKPKKDDRQQSLF